LPYFVGSEADLTVPIFKRIEQSAIDAFGWRWSCTNKSASGWSKASIVGGLYLLIKWKRPQMPGAPRAA
jgi:hypothetical protein